MFDTSLLNGPDPSKDFYFSRDIPPFTRTLKSGIKAYESFIDPFGREVVVLPAYLSGQDEDALFRNGFKVIRSLSVPNEKGCFAYKNPESGFLSVTPVHDLVIMTLFYEETADELQRFYDYYRKAGVEHFYMYYNGALSDRSDLPTGVDISYIEWDFEYWYYDEESKRKSHHAQIPALISFCKRYLPLCRASLMIDTDEFLKVRTGESLASFIQKNEAGGKNLFSVHHWARLDSNDEVIDSIKDQPERGKSVLYSSCCGIFFMPNVHRVQRSSESLDLELFHNKKDSPLSEVRERGVPPKNGESSIHSPPSSTPVKIFQIPGETIVDKPRVWGHDNYSFKDYSAELPPNGVYRIGNVRLDRDYILDPNGNFLSQFTWVGNEISKHRGLIPFFRDAPPKGVRRLSGKTLYLGSTWGTANIGHDVMDGLSRMACYRLAGLEADFFDHIIMNSDDPEALQISDLMGIRRDQIRLLSERPWIVDDLFISEAPGRKRQYKRIVGDYFRSVLSKTISQEQDDRKIFLLNRASRTPLNEKDVIGLSKKVGAKVFKRPPSFHDFYHASVIVSPHSSTLYKLIFCRPGTKVVELISSAHQYSYYYELCRILDLDYHGILCTADNSKEVNDLCKDFHVDTRLLEKILSDE